MTKRTNHYLVEPLRSKEEIEEMKLAIKRGNKGTPKNKSLAERDVLMFLFGINTGLRVNDLVRLKIQAVKDQEVLTIREGKTHKRREIYIGMLRDDIASFIEGKHEDHYLFESQKGNHHVSTTQVYRILTDAGDYIGRKDIGTHTMRKTFGYHHYQQFKDVAILQEIFNHSAPNITMRYIGIRQDEINASLVDFRLG